MSTALGNQAEDSAAHYLETKGFTVVERNWRTPVCEIDIVAKHKNTIYFVEVKFRSSDKQGKGLDYITSKKLQQMQFAAACWVENHKYSGDYELSALEVSADFQVTNFVEQLT